MTIAGVLEDVVERLELALVDLQSCTAADAEDVIRKLFGISASALAACSALVDLRDSGAFEQAGLEAERSEMRDLARKE